MARHRTPSRRTVLATAVVGALVALAFVLAPRNGGGHASLALVLMRPDGSAGPSARFDAATLRRFRSPPRAEPARPDSSALGDSSARGDSVARGDSLAALDSADVPADSVSPAGSTPAESAGTAIRPAEGDTPEPLPAPDPPTLRIPLVLAVRAEQGTAPTPRSLRVGVPAPFVLVGARADSAGETVTRGWGEPVRYYDIAVADDASVESRASAEEPQQGEGGPRRLRTPVTSPDTLWLEYHAQDLACGLDGDSVPRFRTASPPPAGALRDVRLAYSFTGPRGARHTGVLRLDLEVPDPDAPEIVFEPSDAGIRMRPGGLPPADTLLAPRLTYAARCEDSVESHPLTIRFLTSGAGSGRAYLVGVGDARPRLRLEDADGDDVLDAETWDPDGDGRFEATRPIRLPLPDALRSEERAAFLRAEQRAINARLEAEAARRRTVRAAQPDSAGARPPPPQARDTTGGG